MSTQETNKKEIPTTPWWYNLKFVLAGIYLAFLFIKGEVISWYRIQEMFRLQSFHMYGIICSAIAVGLISTLIIKKFNIKTLKGETVIFPKKEYNKGTIIGSLLFGAGWALTGACPGPLYTQFGTGATVILVTIIFAVFGTWTYGSLKDRLPH